MTRYVILDAARDPEDGRYWSNTYGWCDFRDATGFDESEVGAHRAPMGEKIGYRPVAGYAEALAEIRLLADLPSDPWGGCTSLWFDVAEELRLFRGVAVPDEWNYRSGAATWRSRAYVQEPNGQWFPESMQQALVESMSVPDLKQLGGLLCRYSSMLKAAGKSY